MAKSKSLKEIVEGDNAPVVVSSEPPPVPPRPKRSISAMPGPAADVALEMVQQLVRALIEIGVLSLDKAEEMLRNTGKVRGGVQTCDYLVSDAREQIGWDVRYDQPQPTPTQPTPGKPAKKVA